MYVGTLCSDARNLSIPSNLSATPSRLPTPLTMSNLPELEITPVDTSAKIRGSSVVFKGEMEKGSKLAKEAKAVCKLLKSLPVLDENFYIHKKIGEGTYSTVYLASYKNNSTKQIAVKHLTDSFSLTRVQKELRFMQTIGGSDNVVSVLNCLKNDEKDCVVFLMPYLPHKRFSEFVLHMDANELRLYMKNLFIALRRVHSYNVIHRDVKPGNFLYNRSTKEFLLVDFGLAQEVNECLRNRLIKRAGGDENIPINYTKKRKRSSSEGESPSKKAVLSPLKSRENILESNTEHFLSSTPVLPSPLEQTDECRRNNILTSRLILPRANITNVWPSGRQTPSPLALPSGHSLFNQGLGNRQSPSLSPSLVKCQTGTTPKQVEQTKSFTPLVGSKVPSDNFVQVRNSQVVKPKQLTCACQGLPSICAVCSAKQTLTAPRAGTPGFRPPEVLLKYLHQTTAVDMWAAGVILLCVLSGTYPFFKSPSDLAALMEIISLFGSDAVQKIAEKFGRKLSCSEFRKPLDLKKVCRRRRARLANTKGTVMENCGQCFQTIREDGCCCFTGPILCANNNTAGDKFPDSVYHLLSRLLDLDPETRLTAAEALQHPFITQV